jgi:hypothetical protein
VLLLCFCLFVFSLYICTHLQCYALIAFTSLQLCVLSLSLSLFIGCFYLGEAFSTGKLNLTVLRLDHNPITGTGVKFISDGLKEAQAQGHAQDVGTYVCVCVCVGYCTFYVSVHSRTHFTTLSICLFIHLSTRHMCVCVCHREAFASLSCLLRYRLGRRHTFVRHHLAQAEQHKVSQLRGKRPRQRRHDGARGGHRPCGLSHYSEHSAEQILR